MDPSRILSRGLKLIDPVLLPLGFRWTDGRSGSSSGGDFASGEYVRSDRRLTLHFRHSLGLVTYHVGELSIDHATYMQVVLGSAGGNQYPGFSSDPLDAFRHLAHDLANYCSAFLSGSDEDFEVIACQSVQGRPKLP